MLKLCGYFESSRASRTVPLGGDLHPPTFFNLLIKE